jgi:hypothetical protein
MRARKLKTAEVRIIAGKYNRNECWLREILPASDDSLRQRMDGPLAHFEEQTIHGTTPQRADGDPRAAVSSFLKNAFLFGIKKPDRVSAGLCPS